MRKKEYQKMEDKTCFRNDIKSCYHYDTTKSNDRVNYYWFVFSFLDEISQEECRCRKCKKVFPMKFYYNMKWYLEHYLGMDNEIFHKKMQKKVKPVFYRYVSEENVEYLKKRDYNRAVQNEIDTYQTSYLLTGDDIEDSEKDKKLSELAWMLENILRDGNG